MIFWGLVWKDCWWTNQPKGWFTTAAPLGCRLSALWKGCHAASAVLYLTTGILRRSFQPYDRTSRTSDIGIRSCVILVARNVELPNSRRYLYLLGDFLSFVLKGDLFRLILHPLPPHCIRRSVQQSQYGISEGAFQIKTVCSTFFPWRQ